MKQVTLKIEDDHYKIIEKLAVLQGARLEDMILTAAKSSLSVMLTAEVVSVLDGTSFLIHKALGGDDEG